MVDVSSEGTMRAASWWGVVVICPGQGFSVLVGMSASKDRVQVFKLKYTVMITVGGWTVALNYWSCEIL